MKDRITKLIDVKSIVTLVVIANLIFVIDYVMITGAEIDEKIFLLFSNVVTMIVTYFFTKKSTESKGNANGAEGISDEEIEKNIL